MEKQIEVRSQIRLPAQLHVALSQEANKAKRSMNAEIVERLERSFHRAVGPVQDPSNSDNTEAITAGIADLSESVAKILKQLGSERALIRSLALAVVSSADLARKHESDALPEAAAEVLLSLRNLASRFLKQDDETSVYTHIASDWQAK